MISPNKLSISSGLIVKASLGLSNGLFFFSITILPQGVFIQKESFFNFFKNF